jgi:hypothetical protein
MTTAASAIKDQNTKVNVVTSSLRPWDFFLIPLTSIRASVGSLDAMGGKIYALITERQCCDQEYFMN